MNQGDVLGLLCQFRHECIKDNGCKRLFFQPDIDEFRKRRASSQCLLLENEFLLCLERCEGGGVDGEDLL